MIVPSRRLFVVGLGTAVLAPSLVRADSLMKIRGDLLYPKVLAYQNPGSVKWFLSVYEPQVHTELNEGFEHLSTLNRAARAKWLNTFRVKTIESKKGYSASNLHYEIISASDVDFSSDLNWSICKEIKNDI